MRKLLLRIVFAFIDQTSDLARMVAGITRSAPDACYAEFTAPALSIVVWAIHLTPGMGAAGFHPPAVFLSVL